MNIQDLQYIEQANEEIQGASGHPTTGYQVYGFVVPGGTSDALAIANSTAVGPSNADVSSLAVTSTLAAPGVSSSSSVSGASVKQAAKVYLTFIKH